MAELPLVKRVHERLRERGFEVVGLALDRDPGEARRVLARTGAMWPQIFDGRGPEGELPRSLALSTVPATFLFDREGELRRVSLAPEEIEAAATELLNEAAAPPQAGGAPRDGGDRPPGGGSRR